MGAKYVSPNASSYPSDAAFAFGNAATYTYTPARPEYTVRRGYVEPPVPEF